jgi:ABC-type bacteriocin/lantibiotic exporter with double-glycine peptidase domain
MLIILRLIPIIKTLAGQKQSINKSIGAIDAVNELVDGMSKYRDTDKQSELMVNSFNIESIRLDNISYKYTPTAVNALSDISLIFKPSTITAILGPSGSGKSTLVDIISAYRKPTSGSIVINSDTILNVDDKSFTHVFSYLPQDPQIFNGSIFNHIQYGNKFASKEDVYNAAKLSGAYDFISDMSEGFNTLITEDASNLSGGQRQRLDLARVLVRNSPVLILDEPTSGLDPLNEKRFMETIFEIKKMTNKIIIIITHKIETVREVDNIVILEDGKIRNQGNDSYLLKNSDWYATA